MDEFSKHEILDRLSVIESLLESSVVQHKNYQSLPKSVRLKIEAVSIALTNAYLAMGDYRFKPDKT